MDNGLMHIPLKNKGHPRLRAYRKDQCQIAGSAAPNEKKALLGPKTIRCKLLRFPDDPFRMMEIVRTGNLRHIIPHYLI
ncbi:hypothetical protein D3C86_1945030 [compost metagenome]